MSERHELEMKAEEIFNMVFAPPVAWRYAMPTARDTARWMRSCSGIRTGLLKRLIMACRTGCRALCLTCLV